MDVACRAAHQATLAVDGKTVWRGRKFWTRPADLERLWDDLDLAEPGELTVVVEPTRNAWIVVAEWFRRRGATVVMVPTTQSSDLRKYYSKHTKNDRIDSELLARLPLLHPEGLRPLLRPRAGRSAAQVDQAALDDGETSHRGLRDVDDTPITQAEGRAIVKDRYQLEPRRRDNVRHQRMRERRKQAAGQESQESQSAPTSQPASTKPTSRQVA